MRSTSQAYILHDFKHLSRIQRARNRGPLQEPFLTEDLQEEKISSHSRPKIQQKTVHDRFMIFVIIKKGNYEEI